MLHDPSPSYRLSWTPERRKAASDKAKAWWEARRAREREERDRTRQTASGRLRQIRHAKLTEANEIAARWNKLKAEVEEIDKALTLIDQLRPILTKYHVQTSPSA